MIQIRPRPGPIYLKPICLHEAHLYILPSPRQRQADSGESNVLSERTQKKQKQSHRHRQWWCSGETKMASLSATLNLSTFSASLPQSPPSLRPSTVRNSTPSYSPSRRLALFHLGSGKPKLPHLTL